MEPNQQLVDEFTSACGLGESNGIAVEHALIDRSSLTESIRRALTKKLPRLIEAEAVRRILLLEKGDVAHGYSAVRAAIDEIRPEIVGFEKLDEIWLANTSIWRWEGFLSFFELFPVCGGRQANGKSRPHGAAVAAAR
ncbi:hypothetical protein SBA7_1050010 [Candidatus Sulfotelmatobacter sp. SbA7]|nr:hypothetical protein SBA7_1050010 [Candidatus Sulfotelmatobacter sp. SbA7]